MKKIIISAIALLLPLFLFGAEIEELKQTSAVSYFTNTKHIPNAVDFQKILRTQNSGFTLENSTKSLCGALYRSKEDGGRETVELMSKHLVSFDFVSGDYSCEYELANTEDAKAIMSHTIPLWRNLVSGFSGNGNIAYDLFSGAYKPKDFEMLESGVLRSKSDATKDFSIRQHAKDLGVWTDDASSFKNKNVTLSEFVTNLITLNGDYVTGVDETGNILINPKIESQLTTINNKEKQDNAIQRTIQSIKSIFFKDEESANKEYMLGKIEAISQVNYFDRRLFGLYYNFMNIAWGNIFNYAGTLFLAFLSLYLGGNIALKYGMHKLKHEDTQGGFEFPIKARLVAVAMTLMITFIPFPTGEGSANPNGTSGADRIFAQTTIAKKMISYMGNMGTVIADFSAGNVIVVYMEYLLKASNSTSIDEAKRVNKALKGKVLKQKMRTAFYKTGCVEEYDEAFKIYRTFQEVDGKTGDNKWRSVDNIWLMKEGRTFFGRNAVKDGGRVSLELCAELEKEIVIEDRAIRAMSESLEKTIGSLTALFNNNSTSNANIFAVSQLLATQSMGWYSIASIPILHVYLKNTELINISNRASTKANLTHTSMATMRQTQNYLTKNNRVKNMNMTNEIRDEATEDSGELELIRGGLQFLVSKQVYFMMPAFAEVFKASKEMAYSGVSLMKMLPLGKMTDMVERVNKMTKKLRKKGIGEGTLVVGTMVTIIGFMIAVMLYNLMIKVIFAGVVALLITVKIVFYIIDVFIYYFVSPFVVGWQMTIQNNTDKLHKFISNGFVLLVIKPSLIVFSTMMFVIGIEIMHSLYFMIFDVVYSSIELVNEFMGGVVKEDGFGVTGFLIMANIKGIGEIFVDIVGLILAYKLIMDGDKMILDKFGYRDDTESSVSSQVSDKIQTVAGKI
jgi:hypothetical protein